jgi:poly-gamma-glutamate synthesis protein (capsule biosynthesis protein)
VTALLPPPAQPFAAAIAPMSDALCARVVGCSWRDDPRCPALAELAHVEFAHVDFAGRVARGELIVARAIASRAVELFRRLYALGFPIRQARLIDDYGGSDDASMAADNSSAFNFRTVAGSELLSQHARGLAIDINPVENPWRKKDGFVPAEGAAYVDRARVRPGMIVRPGPVVAALDELGWEWGGDWQHARDDHHVVWSRAI